MRFRTQPTQLLDIRFDPEVRIAAIPKTHKIKGMFITPLVTALGDDFARLEPKLLEPPRGGRYVGFSNYPQADCARLAFAAAAKKWPRVPLAEACRQLGREDISRFQASTVGRVTLSLLRDAESTLLKLPEVYRMILSGGSAYAERRATGGVRIEYKQIGGTLDNLQIGTVEGIVLSFGLRPQIEIQMLSDEDAIFDVTWT